MSSKHCTTKILLGFSVLLLIALVFVFPILRNNIHTVIPGKVYRSAQLSPQKLDSLVKQDHIKTVINLEGQSDNPWFLKEKQTLDDNHVQLYNIGLPAKGLPPVQRFKKLIHVFLTAPMPILIHCKNGADRTGLASAIALILYQQADLSTAKQQIAWWYGAVSPSSTGRVVIPMYEAWLTQNHLAHSRTNFLIWTNQVKVMRPNQTHHHKAISTGPSVL